MPCVGDSQNLECDSEGSSASLRDIWKDKVRLLWHDCVWYFCGKMGIKGNQIVSALCCMKTQKIKLNPGSFKVTQVSQGLSRSLMVSQGLSWSLTGSLRVSQGLLRFLRVSERISHKVSQGLSQDFTTFLRVSQWNDSRSLTKALEKVVSRYLSVCSQNFTGFLSWLLNTPHFRVPSSPTVWF